MYILCWALITKTYLYNFDPLKPHFYIIKLGSTGVYIIFLISVQNIDCGYSLEPPWRGGSNEYPQSMFFAEIWKISLFLSEKFQLLEITFSIYLNRLVFVMSLYGCLGDNLHTMLSPTILCDSLGDTLHTKLNPDILLDSSEYNLYVMLTSIILCDSQETMYMQCWGLYFRLLRRHFTCDVESCYTLHYENTLI